MDVQYVLFYKFINNSLTTSLEKTLVGICLKRVGFDEKLRSLDYATYDTGAASKR